MEQLPQVRHQPDEGLVRREVRPWDGELFNCFPRISGDHSYYPTIMDMKDGT